jgi:hypothetical protein
MLLNKILSSALLLVFGLTGMVFGQSLKITPDELELTVGDTVALSASYIDTNDNEIDTTAVWSVEPHQLATVNNKGLLIAKADGQGLVIATLGELSDTIDLVVNPAEEESLLPAVQIVQGDLEAFVGDTIEYSVVYIDTNEIQTDTSGIWTLRPDSLGSIDSASGLFVAERPGEGMVEVHVGDLMAWVYISIFPAGEDPETDPAYSNISLMPRDTILAIGDQVQYEVYYKAEGDSICTLLDSTFVWSLEGMPVGTLSQTGTFDATATGYGLVKATLGDMTATALVIVQDSTADSVINTITITRDSPNPIGYSVMRELTEGEVWTLGGLPHPMNVLNGGQIYFPLGSLTEDIRIHISLPQFAEIRGDSLGWGHEGVLAGVNFTVMVNDTVREPYYFETPLIVGLVYKRGLLDKLMIDPNTLGMYFAVVDGDTVRFDSTGITETVVDEDFNRIFSGVAHFSALAVMGTEGTASAIDEKPAIPTDYVLEQNYPNPFNPLTTFRYSIPEAQNVNISIYDITGRKVATLVNRYQVAGHYALTWNAADYSSGVYFYRLQTASFTATGKMILMK